MESGTVPRKPPPIGSKDEPSRISVVTGMPGRWRQSRKSKSKSFATRSIRIRMALFLTTLIVATVAVVAAATTAPPTPPTPPPTPPPTTTVAVAANDSEVCYGWTRRNNHHHGRFSVRQLGQTSIPTSTSRSILSILRGGGIGRAGSKRPNHRSSSSSSSVRALDDEILWLEQQLRRVHDQKRALKTKLKRSNNADRSSKRVNGTEQQHQQEQEQEQQQQQITNDRDRRRRHQQREEERQLQRQHDEELLTRLEAERDSLLVAKLQLESLRTECETKLLSLEADLSASNGRKADIERSFRKRLAELEASLERTRVRVRVRGSTSSGGGFAPLGGSGSDNHNHNNPELTRAIENACQRAIVDFWNEAHERLRKHEAELRIRHLEELRDERRSTEAAVGKQKEKMRALARAMAVREQGLRQKQKQQQKQEQEQERQQQPPKKSRGRQWKPHEHDEREQERLRLKAIREEAERKSREEEERLWLELERGLKEEREKLERQRLREEDERKRCEREELERQRILRLHAKQQERERLQQQQQQNQKEHGDPNAAVTAAATNHSLDGATDCEPQRSRRLDVLRGIFGSGFPWSSASATSLREQPPSRQPEPQPLPASIENYRQRVPWQPLSLPPKEVVRITSHRTTSLQPST